MARFAGAGRTENPLCRWLGSDRGPQAAASYRSAPVVVDGRGDGCHDEPCLARPRRSVDGASCRRSTDGASSGRTSCCPSGLRDPMDASTLLRLLLPGCGDGESEGFGGHHSLLARLAPSRAVHPAAAVVTTHLRDRDHLPRTDPVAPPHEGPGMGDIWAWPRGDDLRRTARSPVNTTPRRAGPGSGVVPRWRCGWHRTARLLGEARATHFFEDTHLHHVRLHVGWTATRRSWNGNHHDPFRAGSAGRMGHALPGVQRPGTAVVRLVRTC